MAAIHELLAQVQDEALRARLEDEINKLSKQKKFGLVFEEHLPECTPLYDIPIKVGSFVAKRDSLISDMYIVTEISDDNATCINKADGHAEGFPVDDLVCVAELGEPIYPYLQIIDSICNAPESSLWHTLIEADNYHALQLLEYMYAGQVDCIYIDPPYNKEDSKDWKYNCNYVDGNDMYRHSKWLSMMERRLRLAKKLLNPEDSVLIITIDEKEYLHLGMLLERLFPEARIQMVSDVINPRGTTRDGSFSRTDEYIFIVQFGKNSVFYPTKGEKHYVEWYRLRRTDYDSRRGTIKGGTQQFYPIYIDVETEKIVHIGEPLPPGQDRNDVMQIDGAVPVFPIKNDGTEMNWGVTPDTLKILLDNHFVRVRKNTEGKPQQYLLHYISYVQLEAIQQGKAKIEGYNKDGTAIVVEEEGHIMRPGTAWNIPIHNAGTYGSEILASVIGGKRFTFPKSLYSVRDVLAYFVSGKPDALIIDFFAGSGTTLHAINLINAEDSGRRRCILVTNNEIGDKDEKRMKAAGYKPGDPEWEKIGIARFATWPRTVCSIIGKDVNGNKLGGDYYTSLVKEKAKKRKIIKIDFATESLSEKQKKTIVKVLTRGGLPQNLVEDDCDYIVSANEKHISSILFNVDMADEWIDELSSNNHVTELYVITNNQNKFNKIKKTVDETLGEYSVEEPLTLPMSEGFKTNAVYFKLGFLDKNAVALGRQFKEMIPMLWMKAGAHGPCPSLESGAIPQMMICEENKFAVLIDETVFAPFADRVNDLSNIKTVYIVTDSNAGYREMIAGIKAENTYQLYRDYLDNFRINVGRK